MRISQYGRWMLGLCCCLLAACAGSQPEPTIIPTATFTPKMAQGKRLFSQHCASCHATEPDTVIVGPSLFAISDRVPDRDPDLTPEQYVDQSIRQPAAFIVPGYDDLMPSSIAKRLDGDEFDAIVAYVLSLH